jgi:pimeloyl-ACP methyl ester carboxylesterase
MSEIELSAGRIEYTDTGGDGPVIVLLHGLLMDASLWDDVIAELTPGHRCLAPVLPLGAHRIGMKPDADLSLPGVAGLVEEFLDRLDLRAVTLVGNDTGGAVAQLLMAGRAPRVAGGPPGVAGVAPRVAGVAPRVAGGAPRVAGVVLVSCDAFGNFPPGLTGKTLVAAGTLPRALFGLFMQQLRLRPVRRLPIAFGWLTKRGDAATARWIRPVLAQPAVRRDTTRVLRAIAADKRLLLRTADQLPGYGGRALVVWARQDRVMPPEHGRRLAELIPEASLAWVDDSYTLVPLDQPAVLAEAVRDFAGGPRSQANQVRALHPGSNA